MRTYLTLRFLLDLINTHGDIMRNHENLVLGTRWAPQRSLSRCPRDFEGWAVLGDVRN